jgi:hypothetical protein
VKHFAKKSEVVAAIQWTGEMTPELQAFLQGRAEHVSVSESRLHFAGARGPGRAADRGDWIMWSSEGLVPVGDADIKRLYNEVDAAGHAIATDEEIDAYYGEFVRKLDAILVDALRLAKDAHPAIWRDRNNLLSMLRHVFEDVRYSAARRELARIREKITKELWP